MGSLLDLAPPSTDGSVFMACRLRVEYPDAFSCLTAYGNDQQTIVPDKTDRTDFLTRLGPEVSPATLALCKVKQ